MKYLKIWCNLIYDFNIDIWRNMRYYCYSYILLDAFDAVFYDQSTDLGDRFFVAWMQGEDR